MPVANTRRHLLTKWIKSSINHRFGLVGILNLRFFSSNRLNSSCWQVWPLAPPVDPTTDSVFLIQAMPHAEWLWPGDTLVPRGRGVGWEGGGCWWGQGQPRCQRSTNQQRSFISQLLLYSIHDVTISFHWPHAGRGFFLLSLMDSQRWQH